MAILPLNLNRGYAVVDLEMTGTNPTDGLIIEIGIGVKHPEHQDLSTDRIMVRIDRPLPARITRLTGITDRDLAYGGIPIDDALAWLVGKTQGLPLVGHGHSQVRPPLFASSSPPSSRGSGTGTPAQGSHRGG